MEHSARTRLGKLTPGSTGLLVTSKGLRPSELQARHSDHQCGARIVSSADFVYLTSRQAALSLRDWPAKQQANPSSSFQRVD